MLWLGAESAGGLTLPDAKPTRGHLYAPRGVWLDDRRVIVADTGNHRVLIWHRPVSELGSHGPADVVLGQPDFVTEGAQAGGRGPERGMRLPTGVVVHDEHLIVADAWNHRILIWDHVPTSSDVAPTTIVGQAGPADTEENRGGSCGPLTLYWPFGVAVIDGWFYVADTGNRRVLAWAAIPSPDQVPDVVLGQPSARDRDENRGEVGPRSFRWPHDLAGLPTTETGDQIGSDRSPIVFVADAGNHRLLGWQPRPDRDRDATIVIGQHDFVASSEFPYAPQTADIVRFPYAVTIGNSATGATVMAVADTANNRILVWDEVPGESTKAADRVLGQPNFAANGENRWDAVADDTFCWPYGLALHGGLLAVADSGNNRVTVWELP